VLGFYGVMGAAALVWRLAVDGVLPWAEGPEPPALSVPWRIAAGLAAGAVLVAASRAWTLRTEAGRALAGELARLLGPISLGRAWLFALASGLAEEAFFRGALQPRVGFLAATLLFAAAHFVPAAKLWGWALFALVAGALFGALFAATGDLLAPFLAHALVNGLNLRWLASRERPVPEPAA
jgi:membrane protease YdiL (CAAX protease family)